ncbi:hypothetical protein BC833DRAFT_642444, partial [Globomyces pollinis-pini]
NTPEVGPATPEVGPITPDGGFATPKAENYIIAKRPESKHFFNSYSRTIVNFARPSVTLQDTPTKEISYIVPMKKFVSRDEPAKKLFKAKDFGEAEKNIKFITVVGTSGKRKTTFARRFLDLPYTGTLLSSMIVKNATEGTGAHILVLILQETPRHSYLYLYYTKRSNIRLATLILIFTEILKVITKTFCTETTSPSISDRLLIINLDETNALLDNDDDRKYLKKLFRILRNVADSLLTKLSGTHSVDLFEQVKISQCKFVDIKLSLISLELTLKEIILGMTANPQSFRGLPRLGYLLTLCGGVGRYLEIAIIQMSKIGSTEMDGTEIEGFELNGYEYFLTNLQDSLHIDTLLEKLTTCVLSHYPKVYAEGLCSINLSEPFPLRDSQADTVIKFRPLFKIMSSAQRVTSSNYKKLNDSMVDSDCIAFLNAKDALFVNAMIFSHPRIGIQEKQSVVAKKRSLAGSPPTFCSYRVRVRVCVSEVRGSYWVD